MNALKDKIKINILKWFYYCCLCNSDLKLKLIKDRSSPPEVFLQKGILKICSKFTGEHPCRSVISIKLFPSRSVILIKLFPCRSVISIKLLCDFVEIILWHGCSPVNLRHIFRTPFYKNTSARLLHRVKL